MTPHAYHGRLHPHMNMGDLRKSSDDTMPPYTSSSEGHLGHQDGVGDSQEIQCACMGVAMHE